MNIENDLADQKFFEDLEDAIRWERNMEIWRIE